MANRTVKDAHSIKGTNPQYLVEKIIRTRIYECRYWKEECFALSAALMVDKAMELKYVGGVFGGNIKPVPFLCLLLKMLQIQPEKDIVVEFIKNEDFKYVRALGATYMRLTGTSLDCYKYLEPLFYDYRKLKRIDRNGAFHIIHMDEYIDELIREERICDIIMPRIQKRAVLEETNILDPRVSLVEADIDDAESEEEEEIIKEVKKAPSPERKSHKEKSRRSPSPSHRRRSSPSSRRRDSHRHHSPSSKRRSRSRERDGKRDRDHKRDRSPDRRQHKDDDRHKHSSSKKSRHDRDEDRHRDRHSDRDRHRDKDKDHRRHRDDKDSRKEKRSREERSSKGVSEREINEANEMRARLGLPPLRP